MKIVSNDEDFFSRVSSACIQLCLKRNKHTRYYICTYLPIYVHLCKNDVFLIMAVIIIRMQLNFTQISPAVSIYTWV